MPIAIPTPDVVPRRSGEEPPSGSTNPPSGTLMVSPTLGYDFPELEGKEPQQQVCTHGHYLPLD